MGSLLLLRCDRDVVESVTGLIPTGWAIEIETSWRGVIRRLLRANQPSALLFDARELTEGTRRTLVALRKKRVGVPAAAFLNDPTLETAHHAGTYQRHGVEPIFGIADLPRKLAELLASAGASLGSQLMRLVAPRHALAERLITLLDAKPDLARAPVPAIVSLMRTSRSLLYEAMKGSGLPPPGAVQSLFRLWPGMLLVLKGGRADDAAFSSGYGDAASFRRALGTHVGLSLTELRRCEDPQVLIRTWARHQWGDSSHRDHH